MLSLIFPRQLTRSLFSLRSWGSLRSSSKSSKFFLKSSLSWDRKSLGSSTSHLSFNSSISSRKAALSSSHCSCINSMASFACKLFSRSTFRCVICPWSAEHRVACSCILTSASSIFFTRPSICSYWHSTSIASLWCSSTMVCSSRSFCDSSFFCSSISVSSLSWAALKPSISVSMLPILATMDSASCSRGALVDSTLSPRACWSISPAWEFSCLTAFSTSSTFPSFASALSSFAARSASWPPRRSSSPAPRVSLSFRPSKALRSPSFSFFSSDSSPR
mmetsp:Transcript_5087/g.17866  ORF Transcript_5087/g.17866 Transcript_5087/m.17866 type:complete len:277 (-) Transcript_5087:866-1696(-)